MKKVLFGVIMIAMIAAMVAAGTWAYFSDYETSCDNYFGAGVLDLKVDGADDPLPVYFEETCLAPCWDEVYEIVLSNVGCVPGKLNIKLFNLVDNDNGCSEPEADVDTTCGDPGAGEGELSQNMLVEILADCDDSGDYETLVAEGTVFDIADIDFYFCDCISTPEGETDITEVPIVVHFWIPCEVGNIIQSDSISFCVEFSLEQEPCMGECALEVTGFDQPEGVVMPGPYNFEVLVHATGDMACSGWINVAIEDGAGGTVWTGSKYVADLAPCDTVALPFSWTPTAAGSYAVVADGARCPFEVLEPGALVVTGIQQPDYIQICENLSVGVDVVNNGGVAATGMMITAVVDPLGTPLTAPQGFEVTLEPGATDKIAVDFGHVDESWRPGGAVVAGFPANPLDPQEEEMFICPMGFLMPATFEVTGIQQPAGVQPGEQIDIAVDIHNTGDKPGLCEFVYMWVEDAGGATILGPYTGATGVLNPCDTEKVPFATIIADEAWLGTTIYVKAEACGSEVVTCPINIVGGPLMVVTGIQQPAEIEECEDLVVGIDVHNAGGKPGECQVYVEVVDEGGTPIATAGPFGTGVLGPCDTAKIPVNLGHVDETWPEEVFVLAWACDQIDPFVCPVVVVHPPPVCPVPEPCCWCIYLAEWWALPATPADPTTRTEYFCLHTIEWLDPGHTEALPGELGTHVIPDPSWHQEVYPYAGPENNNYTEAEWDPLFPKPPQSGVARTNSILGAVQATGVGYWKSSLNLITWKTRFDVQTPLGPIVLWAPTFSVTPMVGNAGWPYAVGNAWSTVGASSISPPSTSYAQVAAVETITVPAFPGGIECYRVESYAWADDGDGIPEPGELTLSSTNWWHNDYGCPIRTETLPGALYNGYENLSLMWYCFDPPYPPFQ